MSRQTGAPKQSNDGRWLIGWLLRLSGGALLVGMAFGAMGALLKWGVNLPSTSLVTLSVLGVAGLSLRAIGQLLMKKSPRLEEKVDEGVRP